MAIFKGSNNARGEILGGLGSGATTLTLKTGQGALFPTTGDFLLTIEEVDDGEVKKREIVKATGRTGDVFTIVRAFELCPASDIATTQTQIAGSFNDGDQVSLYLTAGVVNAIYDNIEDLEDDKLEKDGLRLGLTANRVAYIDSTGEEKLIALGTASQVLTSNGTTSAPSFESPSADITGQSEDNTLGADDKLLFYKDGVGNRKRNAPASDTVAGLVERATSAEAYTGTDDLRFMTPKTTTDWFGFVVTPGVSQTENLLGASDANKDTTTMQVTPLKLKEIRVDTAIGTQLITVSFTLTAPSGNQVFGQIYKNGSPLGTVRTTNSTNTFTEDFTFAPNDLVQLYGSVASAGFGVCRVSNFRIGIVLTPKIRTYFSGTVTLN